MPGKEEDTLFKERHIHRRASQGGRAGARCERERGREGDMHRGERERECARETYTEEESDKETTQKQKATQKQKEEDEEAWVGGGVH